MPNYLFDVTLNAAIRVDPVDEAQARLLLEETLDAASINLGAWPNGDPVLGEASLSLENPPKLAEVDGEDPDAV